MSDKGKCKPASVRVIPTDIYFSIVQQILAQSGQASVRVTGTSMWPLLHHLRDSVIIVPPQRIRPGDIVLFDRRNGRYALHRVIRTGKNGFTMAGDNQWHMERDLPYDQIVGVVSSINRKGRCISCEKISIKMYAGAVTLLSMPRIYLRQAMRHLLKPLRRSRKGDA